MTNGFQKMHVTSIVALSLLAIAHGSVLHPELNYENGWVKDAAPQPNSRPVFFTFVVREQRIDEVKKIALDVNNPDSAKYGQFLTQSQLDGLTMPRVEDMATVKAWLHEHGLEYRQVGVSNLVVTTTVSKASTALTTRFHRISNNLQSVVRATDYYLPTAIANAVSAVFGLHGLPIPMHKPLIAQSTTPANPVSVTPDVLTSTYNISGVKVSGSVKNRQAVVEFEGQFMNSTDLKTMFKKYVKNYKEGTDDVVYKHFGKFEESSRGTEAELDIQYIMGTAVGIKTEFWEFSALDFCSDLNQWTSNLTSTADIPLVHSVSYGFQGNLTKVHCKSEALTAIDDNFAKLAAKGISIMISSGDSGSGYSAENTQCMLPNGGGKTGDALVGTVKSTISVQQVSSCCEEAGSAPGWTFTPAPQLDASANLSISFNNTLYHTQIVFNHSQKVFVARDVQTLTGDVTSDGGKVTAKNLNKTFSDTTMTFSAWYQNSGSSREYYSNVSASFSGKAFSGKAIFLKFPGMPVQRMALQWNEGKDSVATHRPIAVWEKGVNPPPPPPPGKCTIYSEVQSHVSANTTVVSGSATKHKVQLWPSWPASSPWVTSVGATRFIDQKAGQPEMATDQFGSGGGFSSQFNQDNATWQATTVAKYLSTVDQSTLPPAGSFDPKGRGTPDVSALGEDYQVMLGGQVRPVGGTSASSPFFASLVSLLNEARLNANKPVMGFLNPFLYKNADVFNDVVVGSNKFSKTGEKLAYGWNCSAGWDPVTGLGTPKFDKLLSAAMAAVHTMHAPTTTE